eukprot:COSAG01_NODE_73064_length_251_cov_0.684211_1_plen_76_part_10
MMLALPVFTAVATLTTTTTRFYVAVDGSDTAEGTTRGAAFRTLGRAQRAVRAAAAAGSAGAVDVLVGTGVHRLSSP